MSIFSVIGKIAIAVATYLLEIVAAIMYALGTIVNAITEVLFRLPGAMIAFLIVVTIIESVYMLTDPLLGGATVFFMVIFVGIACLLIGTVGKILCSLLAVALANISPMRVAAVCDAVAIQLIGTYFKINEGDAGPWLSIISLPHAISGWASLVFAIIGKVGAWIGIPLLFGWIGYYVTFIDSASPDAGSVEFWCAVALVATFAIVGLYFGSVLSKSFVLVENEDESDV